MGKRSSKKSIKVINRWLVLNLESPLMSFGGVSIDHIGPTRNFPTASMLVGFLANAMGWTWSDYNKHQVLQNRLIFAVCRKHDGSLITDSQNAQLKKEESGWTTRGNPEGRAGNSYSAPHRRKRDYLVDTSFLVVIRLEPAESKPTLEDIEISLDHPVRPLYIGRKSCLPTKPILSKSEDRWVLADSAYSALCCLSNGSSEMFAQWPRGQGPENQEEGVVGIFDLQDLRNWHAGFHSGSRQVIEGYLKPECNI